MNEIKHERCDEACMTINTKEETIENESEQNLTFKGDIKHEKELNIEDNHANEIEHETKHQNEGEFIIKEVDINEELKEFEDDSKLLLIEGRLIKQEEEIEISDDGDETEKISNEDEKSNDELTLKKEYKCKTCGETFISYTKFKKHREVHKNVEKDQATTSRYRLRKREKLNEKSKHHGKNLRKEIKCHQCSFKTHEKSALNRHIKLHTKPKKSSLPSYLKTHDDDREKHLKCSQCDFKTDNQFHLTQHEKIHEKKFQCSTCGSKFLKETGLKAHLRVHDKSRHLHCDLCGHKSVLRKSLKDHMIRFHLNAGKSLKCPKCDYKTSFERNLRNHLKNHDKKFQCTICRNVRKFATEHQLESHLKFHKNVKMFQCKICELKFRREQNLKAHLKRHDVKRETKFKCEQCNYETDLRKLLLIHKKKHQKFECDSCGKIFNEKSKLENHLIEGHVNDEN